ncbi:TetR family transcriptional regulator [Nocardia sp. 348MFTsu5.1]|uniref:TetR family transcriptional regulator n=1 Tax=Nocardia sp. 348MFTsu5.1 TaxID=1172185 RepID=UPI000366CC76|nr:TetR family transcriptional regulator [Nocardia sp. 348MFTsu5.1]
MPTSSAGTAPDLRTRRRTATRIEVQKAALELFELHGFDDTTVDEIARAAGISPRTYFRYFATKEESILGDTHGFDEALQASLKAACATEETLAAFSLADIEEAFRGAIIGFRHDQGEVAATVLRIRKLVCTNPALSRAALGRCAENTQRWLALVDERCSATTRSRIKMTLEVAQLAIHCAFDEWVNACEPDLPDADLLTIYDAVCTRVRNL